MYPGREVDVSDGFADYCVQRMQAAEYVTPKKTRAARKAKED